MVTAIDHPTAVFSNEVAVHGHVGVLVLKHTVESYDNNVLCVCVCMYVCVCVCVHVGACVFMCVHV